MGLAPKPTTPHGSHASSLSTGQCVITRPDGVPRAYTLNAANCADIQRRAFIADQSRGMQVLGQLNPSTTSQRTTFDVQNIIQNALQQHQQQQAQQAKQQQHVQQPPQQPAQQPQQQPAQQQAQGAAAGQLNPNQPQQIE